MWIHRHCKYLDIGMDYMFSRPLKKALTTDVSRNTPGNIPKNRARTSREEIKPVCLAFGRPHLGLWPCFPHLHVLQEGHTADITVVAAHDLWGEAEEPDLEKNSGKLNGSLQNLPRIIWWQYKWQEILIETEEFHTGWKENLFLRIVKERRL